MKKQVILLIWLFCINDYINLEFSKFPFSIKSFMAYYISGSSNIIVIVGKEVKPCNYQGNNEVTALYYH